MGHHCRDHVSKLILKRNLSYLVRLIDLHEFDILNNGSNKFCSKELKVEITEKH